METLIHSTKFNELLGEDVLQTLRCGVCLEYYRNPVILPCGHTFCYDCILEMAKYKKMQRMAAEIRNLKMSCPNCRFPILVHMVLQRNVTFNYPLASFIEALKQLQTPTTVDASTNTEEDEHAYEYNFKKLEEIREDIDNLFSVFRLNTNVIDDSRRDVERIRQSFNNNSQQSQLVGQTTGGRPYTSLSKRHNPQYSSQIRLEAPHNDKKGSFGQRLSDMFLYHNNPVAVQKLAPPPGFIAMPPGAATTSTPDQLASQDPAIMSVALQNNPAPAVRGQAITYSQELGELVKMVQQCHK